MPTGDFVDFEIHIAKPEAQGYRVNIRVDNQREFPPGYLSTDILPWTSSGDLRTDGQRLFERLFADATLRTAWDQAIGQSSQRRRIRLWIDVDSDVAALHTLPWELLQAQDVLLAADAATPFSRYLPCAIDRDDSVISERPIRVLVMISNPRDLDKYRLASLDIGQERQLLEQALGELQPHIEVDFLPEPTTLTQLEAYLHQGYHVLHYIGHGAFSQRRREAALYLQDEAGNTQVVPSDKLCELLKHQSRTPHLVFLSACQSATRAPADAFRGLGPQLIAAGIPAVVAMQDTVSIVTARDLNQVFYTRLLEHGMVDLALNQARRTLMTQNRPDMAVPVLFMRLKDGQLWDPIWAKTNPYCGLAAFTEDDARFFFGRDKLIAELTNKVYRQRFLAVVGASGSGKSSVVQAGLLPTLPDDWAILKLRPGNDPFAALRVAGLDVTDLDNLASAIETVLQARAPAKRLLLFGDQFEELFALCPRSVQARFLQLLHALIESALPITVVITIRADFYGHLQNSPLGKLLEYAMVNVLPMEAEELRDAIEKPAQKVGLDFEAGLVETIVEDAQETHYALPLLQFALAQLWERQARGVLTYDAYVASGRVAGAIGLRAADAYNGLSTEEKQLARRVFTRLVHYGESNAADTRQRRTLPELVTRAEEEEALHVLLQQLAGARLLVTGEAQGAETVEIIHDALLQEWPQLARWLTEQREFHLWRQRLEAQIDAWEQKDYDDGALLRGALLVEAERWLQEQGEALTDEERDYIQAGIEARERAREAQERRRRRTLAWMATAAVILLVLSIVAGMGWQSSARKERERATAQADAVAEATRALNAESTARAEATRALNAEATAQAEATRALKAEATAEAEATRALNAEATARAEATRALNAEAAAKQQAQIALARQLAAQAQNMLRESESLYSQERLERVVLLAAESLRRYPELTAYQAATDGLVGLPRPVSQITHEQAVRAVAFSPCISYPGDTAPRCGEFIASSADSTVRVWEVATGQEVARIEYAPGLYAPVAFSPDGRWIVSGGCDESESYYECARGSARVSEVATGREVARMMHENGVSVVAFSQDGRWVASGDREGTVLIWEAATGRKVAQVDHREHITAIAFSPCLSDPNNTLSQCEEFIVTGSWDGTARVWVMTTGNEVARMTHGERVSAVAFSPDGQRVISGGCDGRQDNSLDCLSGSARVWMAATGEEISRREYEGSWATVTTVAFSPDGQLVVSGNDEGVVEVWQAFDGMELAQMTYENWVHTVAFSPDGQWVVSGGCDALGGQDFCSRSSTQVWEVTTGREIARITQEKWVQAVVPSPDWRRLATSGIDGKVQVWELDIAEEVARVTHAGNVATMAFSSNGQWVVSGSDDGTALVWEAATGAEVARVSHDNWVHTVAFSPDGQWIVSGSGDQTARVWEATTGHEVARMTHDNGVDAVAFSSDGQWVVSGSQDGTARVWEAATGHEVARVTHDEWVNAVAFSPDGQWVVSGSQDGTARVWEATTGHEVACVTHDGWVNAVAFAPDGQWVVSGSGDGTARVWEAATGSEIARMTHAEAVNTVAFSPDGQWVISGAGGVDSTARVWEATTGREVARMIHIEHVQSEIYTSSYGRVDAVAFSPDGRWVISGGGKTARVWRWRGDDMVEIICERLTRNLTHEEWQQYLGDEPYRATCPNLPVPEE